MGAGRVPVDERLPRVAVHSTYYPSTTTTHYGRAPSMVRPVGRPGTRVFQKSSTYRCTISRYKIGTGRVLAHSCCVYTAVHSTEKLYGTGTLPIYLYMRAITHRPRSLARLGVRIEERPLRGPPPHIDPRTGIVLGYSCVIHCITAAAISAVTTVLGVHVCIFIRIMGRGF